VPPGQGRLINTAKASRQDIIYMNGLRISSPEYRILEIVLATVYPYYDEKEFLPNI